MRISDSGFRWTQQGSLKPDCLDEQPSRRGVYPHAVPIVYVRAAEELSLRDNVRYEIDPSLRDSILDEFVCE